MRAILTCWHKYQPYGGEYYRPIFDFYISNMQKYVDEYDKIYFIDSTWNFTDDDYEKMKTVKGKIIKVPPNLRYYDAYKKVLEDVEEELVMFMDNDMVVYMPDQMGNTFDILSSTKADVVSIYDTIGTMKVPLPDGKNKFCPYWFATRKELLMKYINVDWSPDAMPYTETLGLLTEAMLKDGLKPFEWEEDKSNIYFDGIKDGEKSKDLGYYHIRAGSTPAYLLAEKKYGNKQTYYDYLKNQPKNEYLRQCAWYNHMGGDPTDILEDSIVPALDWIKYIQSFNKYHGLWKKI